MLSLQAFTDTGRNELANILTAIFIKGLFALSTLYGNYICGGLIGRTDSTSRAILVIPAMSGCRTRCLHVCVIIQGRTIMRSHVWLRM